MVPLRKSQVEQLASSDRFLWLTGIEDTFITAPWPKTGRILDEYELTEHYQRWNEDIELIAQLNVPAARYGIPWHRINPAPGQWDWSFADKALDRLLEFGIEPIVDLVHYGLPPWIENAFLNPDFPSHMAEYSSRVAERFQGRVYAYTPLNEPRVTAWYCGKLGWWPPYRRGWKGFVQVMIAVCRGIVESVRALETIDPDILPVHVDATDLYESNDPALADEVFRRQELVFLALDLISGRVNEMHSLYHWLLRNGARQSDLDYFLDHAIELPLIGINLYPLFSRKILLQSKLGLRTRMPYTVDGLVERLGEMYHSRYKVPVFISETASEGSVRRRIEWLNQSLVEVRNLRRRGIPLVGYTWWPMFALVTWAYRQGKHPPAYYLKQMGLWDLDEQLNRVPTPLVREYQRLVACGAECVGELAAEITARG